MFDFKDPVKFQKQIIALNLGAAVLNLGLFSWNLYLGNWTCIMNLASGAFSLWITHRCWQRLPKIIADQKQRVLDILQGRYDQNQLT